MFSRHRDIKLEHNVFICSTNKYLCSTWDGPSATNRTSWKCQSCFRHLIFLVFFFFNNSHSNRREVLAHSVLTPVLSSIPEHSNPHFRDFACANPSTWDALLKNVPVGSFSHFFRPLLICNPTSIISLYPLVPKFCYLFTALITAWYIFYVLFNVCFILELVALCMNPCASRSLLPSCSSPPTALPCSSMPPACLLPYPIL